MADVLAGRYQVQRELGKRAGHYTLLALDLQTQQQVVVKLVVFGSGLEWEDLKLFEREAATLRSLSHPSIPRYLDFFEVETFGGKGFAFHRLRANLTLPPSQSPFHPSPSPKSSTASPAESCTSPDKTECASTAVLSSHGQNRHDAADPSAPSLPQR
jgi:serine/threonine protein kinase